MPKRPSIPVTLLESTDDVGEIVWRLPSDAELAIAHWSAEEQEVLRENIQKILSGYVHAICADLHYAAHTDTEPLRDLVATMRLFSQYQQSRLLMTNPGPPSKLN